MIGVDPELGLCNPGKPCELFIPGITFPDDPGKGVELFMP